ncbi:hypothetical protein OE88DRAFT_1793653 [Heliocybe sulcata]|uniref:2Fe-2S ferredoxin-type domain-containing protein n=1 Tax=Heliocybe sulcata TaxID=5364 RepID=A0A5C3N6A3_9AGAM|nr:hypothetical protein OE88DRAFT_1793653 [Heliocybe sulcata]
MYTMAARPLLTSLAATSTSLSSRIQAHKSRQLAPWVSSLCWTEQRRRVPVSPSARTTPESRAMHTTAAVRHGDVTRPKPGTGIKVHFKDAKGNELKTIEGNEGDDLLSLAHEHDIDLEGACEGSIACSTCHVILTPEHYDLLPEPSDDENDMLDMAFGLTDTSRLGCQVKLTRELDGMVAQLPAATRNMFVDDISGALSRGRFEHWSDVHYPSSRDGKQLQFSLGKGRQLQFFLEESKQPGLPRERKTMSYSSLFSFLWTRTLTGKASRPSWAPLEHYICARRCRKSNCTSPAWGRATNRRIPHQLRVRWWVHGTHSARFREVDRTAHDLNPIRVQVPFRSPLERGSTRLSCVVRKGSGRKPALLASKQLVPAAARDPLTSRGKPAGVFEQNARISIDADPA